MAAARLDSFLVTHPPNIFYLTGFTGSSAALLLGPEGADLFTDPRYTVQARAEVSLARVHILRGPLLAGAGAWLKKIRRGRVGFESRHLSVAEMAELRKAAGRGSQWVPWDGKIERVRSVKDSEEVEIMREAAGIACTAWQEVLPFVKPGVRESDLAAEIEFRMRRLGASGPAFDTIVASGERSALPHARASRKTVNKNELVVFDLGAILRGYSSDLTRTVFVGSAPGEVRRRYQAVLEAQGAARSVLQAGASAGAVDAAARKVLSGAGLADKFVHSTGHGLGLEVHEMPRLARGQKAILSAGMVVTIEPGVYFEGEGGIRIEDDLLVTPAGSELLTDANRELIELG